MLSLLWVGAKRTRRRWVTRRLRSFWSPFMHERLTIIVTEYAADALLSFTTNRYLILLLINLLLLVVGCFLEPIASISILVPVLMPVITKVGIDPVHFGLVMMTTVTLGGMTPPVGVAMYTVCGMLDCSMDEYTREAIPLLAAVLVLVGILIYFPWLVLALPKLIF